MTTHKNLLIACCVGVTFVVVIATVRFLPRQYYRYHAGYVYLVHDPNTCWNGLGKAPTLQFAVPLFADAKSWTPAPEHIRKELRRFDADLSELEVSRIIQSCVASGSSAN
jgi:hypothetical protein